MEKDELIQKVLHVYEQGIPVGKISEEYNISTAQIYQIVRMYATPELKENRKKLVVYGGPKKDISKEEVIENLKSGLNYRKTAEKLGVSITVIRNRIIEYENEYGVNLEEELAKNNIQIHRNQKHEIPIEDIFQRWKNGEAIKDMAKEYGVSQTTIYRLKKDYENIQQQTKEYPKYRKEISMEAVINDLKNKMTISEIAKKYNLSLTSLKLKIKDYERINGENIKDILARDNVFLRTSKRNDISAEQIAEDWKNGMSYQAIAKKYNISIQTAFERKKEYEEKIGQKLEKEITRRIDISAEQVAEEWKNGSSYKQIAEKYNISQQTAINRKKEYEAQTGQKLVKIKPEPKKKETKLKIKPEPENKESKPKIKTEIKEIAKPKMSNPQKPQKPHKIRIGQVWKEYVNGATLTELASRNKISLESMKEQLKNYQSLLFTRAYVDRNKSIGEIARESGCEILDVKNRIKMVLRKEVPTVPVKRYLEYKKLGYTEEKILKILLLEKKKQEKQAKKNQKQTQTQNGDEQREQQWHDLSI